MYKLPYISDKNLWRAVVGACSYVKDTGYFNKATSYYANKYNVDVEDVRKYVRIAQGNGQKIANKKNQRKYYWFAIEYSLGNERNNGCCYFEPRLAEYRVKRGLTARSVKNTLSARDDLGSEYAPWHWFGRVRGFETEEEARAEVERWRAENDRQQAQENHRAGRTHSAENPGAVKIFPSTHVSREGCL